MLSHEDNELLTRTGPGTPMGTLMRRYWLPALFSHQLPAPDCPPVRVPLLSEELVAFRSSDSSVGLLEEHCAHRGASLFFGRNEECGLRCVYHGWKFDRTGQCVDMPSEPADSSFKERIHLTAYPCQERGGVIWAYLGPPELKPPLPDLEFSLVPDSHRFVTRRWQESNWLQAMEGGIDSVHVRFLHRGDSTNLQRRPGQRLAPLAPIIFREEIVPTEYGFLMGHPRDEHGSTHWNVKHWLMPFYKTISRVVPDAPVGGHAWVPIDDVNCLVWSWEWHPDRPLTEEEMAPCKDGRSIHGETLPGSDRTVQNKDNDYLVDRALQKSGRSYTGIRGVGMQDTAMQESMGPIQDRTREHLGTTDTAIIRVRRHLLSTLKEIEAGGAPPSLNAAAYRVRSFSFTAPQGLPLEEALLGCPEAPPVAGDRVPARAAAPAGV